MGSLEDMDEVEKLVVAAYAVETKVEKISVTDRAMLPKSDPLRMLSVDVAKVEEEVDNGVDVAVDSAGSITLEEVLAAGEAGEEDVAMIFVVGVELETGSFASLELAIGAAAVEVALVPGELVASCTGLEVGVLAVEELSKEFVKVELVVEPTRTTVAEF